MDRDLRLTLKRALNRFKKEELHKAVKDWGCVSPVVNVGSSKKLTVEKILDACQEKKIKPKAVFELQLVAAVSNPSSKLWTVYQLTKSPEATNEEIINPYDILHKFKKQLSTFFKHCLCFRQHGESLWFQVAIQDSMQPKACFLPSNSVLIVHYPHSPYIMLTNIKVAYKDFIMQALMNTLQCSEIHELQLTGRSLHSLADMVLNRKSQGEFSQYRLNEVDQNPLVKKTKKRSTSETKECDLDSRLFCEDIAKKRKRDDINIKTFGTNDQPVLEKITYTLETRFRGSEFAPAMSMRKEPFRCRVRFEGTNVLEGIKQLGPAGLATLPLPHHIGRVHSLAKNHYVLADKKKDTTT